MNDNMSKFATLFANAVSMILQAGSGRYLRAFRGTSALRRKLIGELWGW